MKPRLLTALHALGFSLCLSLSTGAIAAPTVDKGYKAYKDGDFQAAMITLRPLAAQGDAYAQYVVGVMYAMAQGVMRDDNKAADYYRKSADQGFSDAQFALGRMYKSARGVMQDHKQAYVWFTKAAEQGHKKAKAALADLCQEKSWACK